MGEGLHAAEDVSEKLAIVPLTPDRYREWDRFCLESPDAWFWHTSQWLEYTLHYRPDLQPRSESFLCLAEDSPVAVCPLIIETYTRGTDSPHPKNRLNHLALKEAFRMRILQPPRYCLHHCGVGF